MLLGVNTAFFVGCAAFVLLGGSQYVVDVEPTYRKASMRGEGAPSARGRVLRVLLPKRVFSRRVRS